MNRIAFPLIAALLAASILSSEVLAQTLTRNTNQSRRFRSVIGGGAGNLISSNTAQAVVAGGFGNTGSGPYAAVGGGYSNSATSGRSATVGGGQENIVTGGYATVGGGQENTADGTGSTVSGGKGNTASGLYAAIAGGVGNTASGNRSAVLGGQDNTASSAYSFAAGRRAKANAQGSFVWADSQNQDFNVATQDSFMVRAQGGVSFQSGALVGVNQQVSWTPGSGSWAFVSDIASKEGFRRVDAKDVLRRVAELPVSEWNYVGYSQRHVGPTAQDWHAAFPLNESEKTINTADMHGVSLAAIKGLFEELKERDKTIAELTAKSVEVDQLKAKLEAVEERLNSLPTSP